MKVNPETLRLLVKELPWIAKYMEDAEEFKVQLMDFETLNLKAEEHYDGEAGGWCIRNRVYIIDKRGFELCQVGVTGKTQYVLGSAFTFFIARIPANVNESVGVAIEKLNNNEPDIRYIVQKAYNYRETANVVIYKLPNKIKDIRTWLDIKGKEVSREIKKVLDE